MPIKLVGEMQMGQKLAFTLTEMMVVVGIIGILAAVAVVSYINYLPRARVMSLATDFTYIMDRAIDYANVSGSFPTARALGFSADSSSPSDDTLIDPASISPYITQIGTNDVDASGTPCGRAVYVNATLNATALGFDPSITTFTVTCNAFNINGKFQRQCWYGYGNTGTSALDNYIAGWINMNSTTGWDSNNYTTAYAALLASSACLS